MVLALVGAAGLYLSIHAGIFGHSRHRAARLLLEGLSNATIIAGLIALVVEGPAKQVFAKDIARNIFLVLFNVNAPPRYVNGLHAVCSTQELSHSVIWEIMVDWYEQPHLLRFEMHVRSSTENIGSTDFVVPDSWIMSSSPGAPASTLERWSGDIEDEYGGVRFLPTFGASELAAKTSRVDGATVVRRASIVNPAEVVRPRETYHSALTGLVVLAVPGILPLVQRRPALVSSFQIQGSALADVNLTLKSGVRSLNDLSEAQDQLVFREEEVSLPGATFLLSFTLRPDGLPTPPTT